jgi:hypothetical protein
MTEISHFLVPGGWKMTFKDSGNQGCSELLPEVGATILIGRSRTGTGCSVVWMDRTGVLRTIDKLAPNGDQWQATVKYDGKYYFVTVGKNPRPRVAGGREILGTVRVGRTTAAAGWKPGGGYDMTGTWGAEANPTGGGRT